MGVSEVVGAEKIGLGGGIGESSGGVRWRGVAKQGGGIVTGRDNGLGMRSVSTK